jgi:hypothetical protein
MSAKNRKLVDFYKEQGGEDEEGRQADQTAWINSEQMRRAEDSMRDAPGTVGSGVSEVSESDDAPSGDGHDVPRGYRPPAKPGGAGLA